MKKRHSVDDYYPKNAAGDDMDRIDWSRNEYRHSDSKPMWHWLLLALALIAVFYFGSPLKGNVDAYILSVDRTADYQQVIATVHVKNNSNKIVQNGKLVVRCTSVSTGDTLGTVSKELGTMLLGHEEEITVRIHLPSPYYESTQVQCEIKGTYTMLSASKATPF